MGGILNFLHNVGLKMTCLMATLHAGLDTTLKYSTIHNLQCNSNFYLNVGTEEEIKIMENKGSNRHFGGNVK